VCVSLLLFSSHSFLLLQPSVETKTAMRAAKEQSSKEMGWVFAAQATN
jgi:hypothetical protein